MGWFSKLKTFKPDTLDTDKLKHAPNNLNKVK